MTEALSIFSTTCSGYWKGRSPPYYFDAMVAHPDCTYLTSAGLHWNARGRMVDGVPRAEMTERALEDVRRLMRAPVKRWVIENPTGCISTRIRKYDQRVHPYEFGDDASKGTCLWMQNLPLLAVDPAKYVKPRLVCDFCNQVFEYGLHKCPTCRSEKFKPRWGNQTDSGQNKLAPSEDRWKLRSETYPGIAEALADCVVRGLA